MLNKDSARRLTFNDQWFCYWFPYQFVKLNVEKPKHVYLPVNRKYKPLGITTGEWIDYELYAFQAVVFTHDPHEFEEIWHDPENLYLYEDSVRSRLDYFVRLETLLSRSIKLNEISN